MKQISLSKTVLTLLLVVGAQGEISTESKNAPVTQGYHALFGVPAAQAIRLAEELPSSRISGGLGSYRDDHKFFAGLLIDLTSGNQSVCGASLLSHTKLITAAQCWYDGYSQGRSIVAVLGWVYLYSGGTRVNANAVTVHPGFNPYNLSNDLAILTVPWVYYTTGIKPILLTTSLSNSFEGASAKVVGYGRTSHTSPITSSQIQRHVFVSVISNSACNLVYGGSVTAAQICTSGAGGKGPCPGDGGGPLVLGSNNNELIGVTSFLSANGCQSGDPSGYSRISFYYYWILANLDQASLDFYTQSKA